MALQEPSQLQNIATSLQSVGAGLQGNMPQFQARQLQKQAYQDDQKMKQDAMMQDIQAKRQASGFQAAQAALNLANNGNYEGVIQVGIKRLQGLQSFPDADPSDTQRLVQLAVAARNGEEEAGELLKKELEATVEMGIASGTLEAPQSKVVGSVLVDDRTGEPIFDGRDKKRPTAKDANGFLRYTDGDNERVFKDVEKVEEELSGKDKLGIAEGLRKEIATANKDFTLIANSWDRISASADDPSAAGDMALIFNFMKMLDPGSTVREGEFATAQQAAGIPTRLVSKYNQLVSGERLAIEQRQDFFGQAQNIFDASKSRADQITSEYVRIGERNGIDREDIVVDRGESPSVSMAEVVLTAEDIAGSPNLQSLGATPGQRIVNGELVD